MAATALYPQKRTFTAEIPNDLFPELAGKTYFGHGDCGCIRCMDAALDDRLALLGHAKGSENFGEDIAGTRTRYATPGTRTGRGYVRKVSDAQVGLIKRLMAERDTTNLVRLPGSEDVTNMSLTGARDLIERLFACPMKPNTPAVRPATDPMKNFLKTLLSDRNHGLTVDVENISFTDARKAIDFLKTQPYAARKPVATPETPKAATRTASGPIEEDGMYTKGGEIFKVQKAVHGSGKLYAKKFNTETKEFEYAGRAPLFSLTSSDKMTLEQASEFSVLYGVCIRCAKVLIKESSIAQGMGDTCASKM